MQTKLPGNFRWFASKPRKETVRAEQSSQNHHVKRQTRRRRGGGDFSTTLGRRQVWIAWRLQVLRTRARHI
jgi:hypothetical protein